MKRIAHDGDEEDVHSPWRHLLSSYQRAGAASKVKRRTRRRERQEGKRETRERTEEP